MAIVRFFRNLYRGQTTYDFIGRRKWWYVVSLVLVVISIGSMTFRGFNWGIEFSGGSSFLMPKPAGTSLSQARAAVEDAGVTVQTAQEVGTGGQQKYNIKTEVLGSTKNVAVKNSLANKLGIKSSEVNDSVVSSSWGSDVTKKGLIALVVFLVLVSLYIGVRFEQKMAIAGILALIHDLVLTAGLYSVIGFEVTPSTVIGLLTILGFSLYDTVVVFDKVQENTKGVLSNTRMTYGEAANTAVNQTLMRSINTSLISLFPVGGLLFVGAGLLGVGTLKDLALVLFVGLAVGAYSSLFLATPWVVELKEREPRYAAQKQRVLARRAKEGAASVDDSPGSDKARSDATASEDATPVSTAAGGGHRPPRRRSRAARPGHTSSGKRRR